MAKVRVPKGLRPPSMTKPFPDKDRGPNWKRWEGQWQANGEIRTPKNEEFFWGREGVDRYVGVSDPIMCGPRVILERVAP